MRSIEVHKFPYLHEKCMSVVHWIPELKCKDGVRAQRPELLPQLVGRQSILIEAVVPADAAKDLELATDEPITRGHDFLQDENSLTTSTVLNNNLLTLIMG